MHNNRSQHFSPLFCWPNLWMLWRVQTLHIY